MRVLVLCEYESLNGGERSFLEAARRITAADMEIIVAAPADGPLRKALRRYGLRHLPLDLVGPDRSRPPRARLQERVAQCITQTQAHLVHANSLSMSRLVGPVVERLGVPSIGHLRDIIRLSRGAIEDLNRHKCLLAVSQATKQWYVQAGLSAGKTWVAYNGVDLDRFRPRSHETALRQELDIPLDCVLVGSVGQIGMRKGVDLFVEAASQIAGRLQNVHFVYIGRRYSRKQEAVEFEESVRHRAVQGDLQGRFHFVGVRSGIERVLAELSIYVHAARQEPLGRVLLEAGATGSAIVATEVGGTLEIYPACSAAAYIVPPESPSALAKAIGVLLEEPEKRHTLGARACARVAEAFDGEIASRGLENWYREISSGN